MTEQSKKAKPVSFEAARQKAIDVLCERFAEDAISVAEFEDRVDRAHQAASAADLRKLLADLPSESGGLPARRSRQDTLPAERRSASLPTTHARKRGLHVGIFGASIRRGRWRPAERSMSIALMGGVELDFRDAELPPGVTEVTAIAVMGGVEIIVPPDIHVETAGIAILGGFEHGAEDSVPPGPDTPILRINGFACMGGVEITTRYPGETPRDARKRRKDRRRERAARRRGYDRS